MKWTTFKFVIGAVWSHLTSETSAVYIALHNKGNQTIEVVCAQQCEGSYYTYRLPSISSEY
ncbi:hypothetical protein CsSME_00023666 [Camellia sinensis var. sinensis]